LLKKCYDYYPFGMMARSETEGSYKFGYGGQEMDNEITGISGTHYTAEYWMYDSRLARRWNIDPMTGRYPHQSGYSVFNNNPIFFKDPTGLQGEPTVKYASGVDDEVVSDHSKEVIKDIASTAGLTEITVTSTYRSSERQINAMYTNLIKKDGVKTQKALYGSKGDQVIDAYLEASGQKGATVESIKAAMLTKASEVGFVSNHSNSDYSVYNTIDISYKNLTESQYKKLKQAALDDPRVQVVLGKEEGDKALHLEIPVPVLKNSNAAEVAEKSTTLQQAQTSTSAQTVPKTDAPTNVGSSPNSSWNSFWDQMGREMESWIKSQLQIPH